MNKGAAVCESPDCGDYGCDGEGNRKLEEKCATARKTTVRSFLPISVRT